MGTHAGCSPSLSVAGVQGSTCHPLLFPPVHLGPITTPSVLALHFLVAPDDSKEESVQLTVLQKYGQVK